jgi:hypothetical protein
MADDEQTTGLIKVSDIFGASKPAIRLIEAVERGVGNFLRPWQMRRIADAEISNYKRWQSALEDSGLSTKLAELTLQDRATIRLAAQEAWRQNNREAISIAAATEFKETLESSTNLNDAVESLEVEWVDRFWRLAQDVTNADLQKVWGRILARHTSGTTKYSARCLEALSLLSREEAHLLEKIASLACSFDGRQNDAIILDVNSVNNTYVHPGSRAIREAVGTFQQRLLGSIGILIESGFAHSIYLTFEKGVGRFRIAGEDYTLTMSQKLDCDSGIGSGVEISSLGSELISLIATKADANYVAALASVYQSFGLSLSKA